MTKKERIAELEREVAELKARFVPPVYGPYWNVIPPYQPWWNPNPYYGPVYALGSTTVSTDSDNVTYIGAAS